MNAIYSIRNDFTSQIFDGSKFLEFRNSIGKELGSNDTIYVYETKRNAGSGAVIGSVQVKDIVRIKHSKIGTTFLLPYYIEKFGTEEERRVVERAMKINLEHYDKSIVLDYMYQDKLLHYMETNNDVPSTFERPDLYYHFSYLFTVKHSKAKNLLNRCDEWATKIGFYDEYGESYWKYTIKLTEPVLFGKPKAIEEFKGRDGKFLTRAPQSWCYTFN